MKTNLSKIERKHELRNLEGWFSNNAVLKYSAANKNIYDSKRYNVLKLAYLDPHGNYALYSCLQLLSNDQANETASVATLASGALVNSHNVGIQGVVASYNQDNNGQIKLELVDFNDKTTWTCYGDGKKFLGTAVEIGLNTAAKDDKALGGGLVGGFILKKLKNTPKAFKNFNFNKIYKTEYNSYYSN
jgi:hypothetical protein